jgi:hypothetical protein
MIEDNLSHHLASHQAARFIAQERDEDRYLYPKETDPEYTLPEYTLGVDYAALHIVTKIPGQMDLF